MNSLENVNEINNSTELSKHPAKLILADIEMRQKEFHRYRQQLISELNDQSSEIEQLKKKIEKHICEESAWLEILRSYWSREVDIINLTYQLQSSALPSDKAMTIEKIKKLNESNAKVENTYQKKSRTWKEKIFLAIVITILLIGTGGFLYAKKPWNWGK